MSMVITNELIELRRQLSALEQECSDLWKVRTQGIEQEVAYDITNLRRAKLQVQYHDALRAQS